ncbi:MAG: adaptor protein MecA [Firmicutes bacterium]|nr:adaptor protein MecA [Bacillota bacterium]
MYIETVSPNAVAICLLKEEIELRGIAQSMSAGSARELVRQVLREAGQEPWQDMEIELFSRDGDVLIMARPAAGGCALFVFSAGETAVQAALACPAGLPSSLLTQDGRYYLALRCDEQSVPNVLYEYGEAIPKAERLLAHLREHGACLIDSGAVDALKGWFGGDRKRQT